MRRRLIPAAGSIITVMILSGCLTMFPGDESNGYGPDDSATSQEADSGAATGTTAETTPESEAEPAPGVDVEVDAGTIPEPTAETVTEPTTLAADDSTVEPVSEPAAEPAGEYIGEPTVESESIWQYDVIAADRIADLPALLSLTESIYTFDGFPLLETVRPEDGLHIALYPEKHMVEWKISLYMETEDKSGFYEIDLNGDEGRRYRYMDTDGYRMGQSSRYFYLIYKPDNDLYMQHGLSGEGSPLEFTIGATDERISLENYTDFLDLQDLEDLPAGKRLHILIDSHNPDVDWNISFYCSLKPDQLFTLQNRNDRYSLILPVDTHGLAGTEVSYFFRLQNDHYSLVQLPTKTFMIVDP